MQKKITSNVKIDVKNGKLNVKTVDKKSMSVIYFEGGFYVKPKTEDNYTFLFNKIKKEMIKYTKDNIENSKYFEKDYRFFIDIADERIAFNKPSFLTFQLYVKPTTEIINSTKNFKEMVKKVYSEKEILEKYQTISENNNFTVSKTKC